MALVYKMAHLIAGVLVKCTVGHGTPRPNGIFLFVGWFVCCLSVFFVCFCYTRYFCFRLN